MPPQRRWTFLVVPHGSDSPRGFSLSETLVKRLAIFGGVAILVASIVFRRERSNRNARRLFMMSNLYLIVVMVLLVL